MQIDILPPELAKKSILAMALPAASITESQKHTRNLRIFRKTVVTLAYPNDAQNSSRRWRCVKTGETSYELKNIKPGRNVIPGQLRRS